MTTKVWGTPDDSIFLSIKKFIGIDEEAKAFDPEILSDINTILFTLQQIGIGGSDAFVVTSEQETWRDLIGDSKNFEAIKTYIALKTKMLFDPSSSSFVMTSIENQIHELEWRLYFQAEFGPDTKKIS